MTLRARLIWSVTVALLAAIALAGAFAVWQARRSVKTEMDSALDVARQTVTASIEDLSPGADSDRDLRRLSIAFDGDRHIHASLIDRNGHAFDHSVIAATATLAPDWFVSLIGVARSIEDIAIPTYISDIKAVRLETDPRNEILEVWNSLRNTALLVAILCFSAGTLLWWSIGRILKPFTQLSTAFAKVGEGSFDARVTTEGMAEAKLIAGAFNRMAEDLSASRARNLVLYDRLIATQETERVEIARDLHDDIGPLLLAINIDVSGVEGEVAAGKTEMVMTNVQSIRDAVRQAQHQLRSIVNRLRPVGLAEFGVAGAIENLVAFWQPRHPDVRFTFDISPGLISFGEKLDITIFRIVQEGLNNALRHGRPTQVQIILRCQLTGGKDRLIVEIMDDGFGNAAIMPGFGLVGMRERVEAAGGTLDLNSAAGRGFAICASLPLLEPRDDNIAVNQQPLTVVT